MLFTGCMSLSSPTNSINAAKWSLNTVTGREFKKTSSEWDTEPCQQSAGGRRGSSWRSHQPWPRVSGEDVSHWSSESSVYSCFHQSTCTTSCHTAPRRTSSNLVDQPQLRTQHTANVYHRHHQFCTSKTELCHKLQKAVFHSVLTCIHWKTKWQQHVSVIHTLVCTKHLTFTAIRVNTTFSHDESLLKFSNVAHIWCLIQTHQTSAGFSKIQHSTATYLNRRKIRHSNFRGNWISGLL